MKNSFNFFKKLVFLLVLTFVSFLGKGQVDFRIVNYSSVPGVSLTFKVQIKAPGTTAMISNVVPITFSNALVTGFTSIAYASNYSGYSSTPSFSAGTLTVSTTAPASPTTIANAYEDYFTIVMTNNGTASDLTDITFGSITGVSPNVTTGIYNALLPVKFISFTANTVGDEIVLNWATATEKNNDVFEVERSLDGINFTPIGTQKGANNSNNVMKYHYVDATKVSSNVIYYRVKQVDYNKNNSYSNVAVVKMYNSKSVIAIFPNPANNTVNVVFNSFEKSLTTITLSDNIGGVIKSFDVSSKMGENRFEVDVSEIPKGIYVINLIVAGNRHAIRFVKN